MLPVPVKSRCSCKDSKGNSSQLCLLNETSSMSQSLYNPQSLYGGQFTLSTPLINQIFVFHSPADAAPQFLQKLTPFTHMFFIVDFGSLYCRNNQGKLKKNSCQLLFLGNHLKCTWLTRAQRRCPITGIQSCDWIAVIGHPRDRMPITRETGARMTNHNREFCYWCD